MNLLLLRLRTLSLFGLLLACAAAFATPSEAGKLAKPAAPPKVWQVVRIASEGARPPFNYFDNNNELAGFEIDLGRELCRRMEVTCTFVQQDWDGMIPGLIAGHFDAIMAAMEITDERQLSISFSDPYIRMPSAFIAARDRQIHGAAPADLAGRSIGVEAGGPHEAYVRDKYQQSDVHTYATLEDAILDLAEGRLDAVIGDKDAIENFMSTRREARCCKLLADVAHDPAYFGAGIAVGLRPEDEGLKAMFNKALKSVIADGTYEQIRARYFSFAIY